MQRWGNCNFRLWPTVGGCGPLTDLTVLAPLCPCWWSRPRDCSTKVTSLSGNQVFTFTSLTWILSRKNGKTVQKFYGQHAEMRLLVYHSVPCVFWKFEERECLGLKTGGGELCSLAFYGTLTTVNTVHLAHPTKLQGHGHRHYSACYVSSKSETDVA